MSMGANSGPATGASIARGWGRWLLLGLTLTAWLRVTWRLDAKNLWWDESLSLQRAESALLPLLRGDLVISDGLAQVTTIDQHPFFYFLLQGGLMRLAGDDEFVLRFVSAAAVTLLVAVMWVFGRAFVRRGAAPRAAPLWAALLTALHPFLLWYGQEARPYATWALLAVLSTYLLLISLEPKHRLRWRKVGYAATLVCFLATHYYAVLLLPVHAAICFVELAKTNRKAAFGVAAAILLIGAGIALVAAQVILGAGGGDNFYTTSLEILLPDLLNAFSLGLSVNIDQVWGLDLVFAATAALGAAWLLRHSRRGGWIPVAAVLIPVVGVLAINAVRGAYMNARHLSLLVGPFAFLIATGLATVGLWRRWAAAAVAALLLVGFCYSTINYHTMEEYAKDDFDRLGQYLAGRIMPGDVVLISPRDSRRIFEYYAPLTAPLQAMSAGENVAVYGTPLVNRSMDETRDFLGETKRRFQRIWLLRSGTMSYIDPQGEVEAWLKEHLLRVRDAEFFSHSSLRAQLYLPEIPVFTSLPADVQHISGDEFGDLIRLAGYSLQPSVAGLPQPVSLYWQVAAKPERRYKYILRLVERAADGSLRTLGEVEREPYEGDIPTTYWDPGKTIMEFVELPIVQEPTGGALSLALTLYDGETLEKLPVTTVSGGQPPEDGVTVLLPVDPEDLTGGLWRMSQMDGAGQP
jgi:uncharacterized membrane protein